jgi:hypothetical protein
VRDLRRYFACCGLSGRVQEEDREEPVLGTHAIPRPAVRRLAYGSTSTQGPRYWRLHPARRLEGDLVGLRVTLLTEAVGAQRT